MDSSLFLRAPVDYKITHGVEADSVRKDEMNCFNYDPFYSSPLSLFYRRHTPYMGQPDYRIHELNKRLQQRSEVRLCILVVS